MEFDRDREKRERDGYMGALMCKEIFKESLKLLFVENGEEVRYILPF